ncbi:MAG: 23S rRNA (uracil(1939)-C(5))-methyltransferase RlmD [Cyanobacteria bacterium P01_C01_bin.89]
MARAKTKKRTKDSATSDIGSSWKQGELLELAIESLADSGDGLGRWGDRVVFVPDTVPGDRVEVRLTVAKPRFGRAQLRHVLLPSRDRVRAACIVADKCGGCQWQGVSYETQLAAKTQHIRDVLQRIGGFEDVPISPILGDASGDRPGLHYRNKSTYPVAAGPSTQTLRAGYYRKGSHQLVNLNQCPVQDDRLDPLLAQVKKDAAIRHWQPYDEKRHTGNLRHLSLRVGRRTGEMLLTLVSRSPDLPELEKQATAWLKRFPNLVGVCLNHQPNRGNQIFGTETRCIVGQSHLTETFAGLDFHIGSTTFFQINTERAEALIQAILQQLQLTGTEIVVDAYCGVGTLTLPMAKHVKKALGIEVHAASIDRAWVNARLNELDNVEFRVGKVEESLPKLLREEQLCPDVVMLDPPRKGCKPEVLDALLHVKPARIVYVSCKPATLARDLKYLSHSYQLDWVQPADFFPQTPHVECAVCLSLRPSA